MRISLAAGLLVAIGLTGATSNCQVVQDINSLTTILSGSVSPSQVVIATNLYNAAAGTAYQYLKLPLCPTAAPLCRTQIISQSVYNNVAVASKAVKALDAYVDANPGQAVPVSNYNALVIALQALNGLVQANSAALAAATK
jgi:hypothetical protein